jgi:hypothetical protein
MIFSYSNDSVFDSPAQVFYMDMWTEICLRKLAMPPCAQILRQKYMIVDSLVLFSDIFSISLTLSAIFCCSLVNL